MKKCDEESDEGYILEVDIDYPKKLHDSIVIYHCMQLYAIYMIKNLCCSHKNFKTSIKSWISV